MANHRIPAPKWLNKSYMQDILASYFGELDLKVHEMDVTPGSKEGDNYLGQIFRIKVVLDRRGIQNSLSIIGKLTPETKLVELFDSFTDLFQMESSFFSDVLPLLKEANKGLSNARKFAPSCFHIDYENKMILMDDLKVDGYEMEPVTQSLSKQHALVVVEALAALHSASYRVLQKKPEFKEKYSRTHLFYSPVISYWFDNNYKALDKNIDDLGLPDEWCKKLRSKREEWDVSMVPKVNEDELNFILHGDPWMNNIMFHFKDGVVDDVKLLDYQTVAYGSFAIDLLYFLFTSVQAKVLVNDLDLILRKYFETLAGLSPDIPNLSFERIQKEFYDRLVFGFMMVVMFRPNFRNNNPPDMEKVVAGQLYDLGFHDETFISDFKLFLPFFDKLGLL